MPGTITEGGIRANVSAALSYCSAWVGGVGCVPIANMMEDAATAEIARVQLWQWVHHGASTEGGKKITADYVSGIVDEEVRKLQASKYLDTASRYLKSAIAVPVVGDFLVRVRDDPGTLTRADVGPDAAPERLRGAAPAKDVDRALDVYKLCGDACGSISPRPDGAIPDEHALGRALAVGGLDLLDHPAHGCVDSDHQWSAALVHVGRDEAAAWSDETRARPAHGWIAITTTSGRARAHCCASMLTAALETEYAGVRPGARPLPKISPEMRSHSSMPAMDEFI